MKDKTYKETLEEIIEHETKIMRSKKKHERTENTSKAYVKKLRESAQGGGSELHKSTKSTLWEGMQLIEDEERYVMFGARIQEKFDEWTKHWQVVQEAQGGKKPLEDMQFRSQEETTTRLKASDLKRAAAVFPGWHRNLDGGFHSRVPLDLTDGFVR